MGQKIHPTGFRLPVTRAWASRWYASNRNFSQMLAEDLKVREFLKAKLKNAAVSRILIERPAKNARITIFSARPGVVIGKNGKDIEMLKAELTRRLGGAEIARMEWYREGRVPLHTLRADVDYGVATAFTTYGTCGVKVWIFKGEIMEHDPMAQDKKMAEGDSGRPRRDAA